MNTEEKYYELNIDILTKIIFAISDNVINIMRTNEHTKNDVMN